MCHGIKKLCHDTRTSSYATATALGHILHVSGKGPASIPPLVEKRNMQGRQVRCETHFEKCLLDIYCNIKLQLVGQSSLYKVHRRYQWPIFQTWQRRGCYKALDVKQAMKGNGDQKILNLTPIAERLSIQTSEPPNCIEEFREGSPWEKWLSPFHKIELN